MGEKQSFIEQYKELGLRVSTETGSIVVAYCPFHGDKTDPQLLVSKESGKHRCFVNTCVAYPPGDVDDYSDLLFGRTPKRSPAPDSGVIIQLANAKLDDELAKTEEPIDVDLANSGKPQYIGHKVRFKATSAGKDLQPYASPKKIRLTCKMGLKICGGCSIGRAGGLQEYEVSDESPDVLRLIEVSEDQQKSQLSKSAGVYPKCPRFEYKATQHYTVEDIRMIPEISFNASPDAEYTIKQGYHVGHGLKTNTAYEFQGIPLPDPKDQRLTYLLNKANPIQDSVDSFKMTEKLYESLKIFQVPVGVNLATHVHKIAMDLSANVTKIYQREDLIIAIDLIYHSVLRFNFRGVLLTKGWTEGLIIGDTRCGKTETVTKLIQHYRAGEISTGENCSFAGLVGGLQQIGQRWSITWGKLPLNDKRLFVLDEISGMPVEDIGKMSGIRSSGIAEITKVQSEKTFSRTRLLWVGNPRSSRPLGSYDTGVQAIPELIGRPEDIARFDLAIAVMSGDVPLKVVNSTNQPVVEHKYSTNLCSKLVAWAWSRKAENVEFSKEAEELCLELSMMMGKKYTSLIPLVEPAEFRIKLARLSVACAARVFSTTDGENLVVRAEHTKFVYDFLNTIYEAHSLNYAAYSKARILEQQLKHEDEVAIIVKTKGPTLVEGLLSNQYFRLQDFEDLFDLDKKELKGIVSQLVRNRAIKHIGTAYVKTPAFINLLRKLQVEGVPEPPQPAAIDY